MIDQANTNWANAVSAAVDTILNTRDFCGNEKRATLEMLADDFGMKGAEALAAFKAANWEANRQWNKFQRAAGVPEKNLF